MNLTRNGLIVLISIIFVAGAGTAYAGLVLPTITLGGNVQVDGTLDMKNNKITNVGTPTVNTDAATKAYVDFVTTSLSCSNQQVIANVLPGFVIDPQCIPSCQQGEVICNNICVDTSTDAANCGVCNNVCAQGQSCIAGQCILSCQPEEVICNNTCVDTSTDAANCGVCNNVCAQGQSCIAGQCILSCQPGEVICDITCVDKSTDNANCGACNNVCGFGQLCINGVCLSVG